jgi:hypothetical protein
LLAIPAAEPISTIDLSKEIKVYSFKAPIASSIEELKSVDEFANTFAISYGFKEIKEVHSPSTVVKDDSKGWSAGIVRGNSYQDGLEEVKQFMLTFRNHQGSFEKAGSQTSDHDSFRSLSGEGS